MQGTVASHDQSTGSGHVLTDDGVRLAYSAEALADHIRHLRLGQRVFIDVDGDLVTSVKIWH